MGGNRISGTFMVSPGWHLASLPHWM